MSAPLEDRTVNIIDLSSLGESERRAAVLAEGPKLNGTANTTIFQLTRDARRKAADVVLAGYDLDNTLTGARQPHIPDTTLAELRDGRTLGISSFSLTGRTQELVDPLYHNHDNDPGFAVAYTELGAFRVDRPGAREHFLATRQHELELLNIRKRIDELMDSVRRQFNVTLLPNLGRTHASLDSLAAVLDDGSHPDRRHLERVTAYIRESVGVNGWNVHISGGNTFDYVPHGISKGKAMPRILEEHGVTAGQASYLEDSPNGADVLRQNPAMLRGIVYGADSRPELLDHADIASWGTANADPLIRYIHDAKRAG